MDSCVKDQVIVHLGLYVSRSAHNCGCAFNGSNTWQQFEYYYYQAIFPHNVKFVCFGAVRVIFSRDKYSNINTCMCKKINA